MTTGKKGEPREPDHHPATRAPGPAAPDPCRPPRSPARPGLHPARPTRRARAAYRRRAHPGRGSRAFRRRSRPCHRDSRRDRDLAGGDCPLRPGTAAGRHAVTPASAAHEGYVPAGARRRRPLLQPGNGCQCRSSSLRCGRSTLTPENARLQTPAPITTTRKSTPQPKTAACSKSSASTNTKTRRQETASPPRIIHTRNAIFGNYPQRR